MSPPIQAGQFPILYPIPQISLEALSQMRAALDLLPLPHDINKKLSVSSALRQENLPREPQVGAEPGGAAGPGLPWPADRLHELREVFSTPRSCDSATLIPGGIFKNNLDETEDGGAGSGPALAGRSG